MFSIPEIKIHRNMTRGRTKPGHRKNYQGPRRMVVVLRSSYERMLDHGVWRNIRKFVGISVLPRLCRLKMLMCRGLSIQSFQHTIKCVVGAHANKKNNKTQEQSDANLVLITTANTEKQSAGKQGQCLFLASTHPFSRHFSARALRVSTFAINPSR